MTTQAQDGDAFNLATATEQDVFDYVVTKLIEQGRPSKNRRSLLCLYRGPDGSKCAAGWLIPDAEYAPVMEGKRITAIADASLAGAGFTSPEVVSPSLKAWTRSPGIRYDSNERMPGRAFLLQALQAAHDLPTEPDRFDSVPSDAEWLRMFRENAADVAQKYDLNDAVTRKGVAV